MNKIEVENLTMEYQDKNNKFAALNNVSLTIKDGEFVSIIGPSGCGKSTLLSIIEGINKPTKGNVKIDQKIISGPGIDRSVVFQHYSLFPWMTAQKNIEFGIKQIRKNLSKTERKAIAYEFLNKVGLGEFKNKYPSQLSGGMQQRVAIARALAMDTDIILMDEPFGALDTINRTILQDLLLELWEGNENKKRKTVVFVTHDIDEAILLSDRIIIMSANPGQVYKEIEVPLERPRNRANLIKTDKYNKFRNLVVSLFYNNIIEQESEEKMIV